MNNLIQKAIELAIGLFFFDSYYNVLPENNMEVDDVEMRFKAVNNKNAPDINTIYVGEEFFMFLEYKGGKAFTDLIY